jgi:membrane associated rhomboid family serine protease
MFVLIPLQLKEPGGRDTIPTANALLIAVNVVVFFLNQYLGWPLAVGRDTGLLTLLTHGFAHASPAHLLGNMWVLWLFGNPVNRRLGNGYYLLAYLGTLVSLGIFARVFLHDTLVGASGAIFAVILLCLMLIPRALVRVGYVALFPFTLLVGLFSPPSHWVFWFLRWGDFAVRAWIGLALVPLLEFWGLWWWGWNWTNLAHLFGLVCGVAILLLLPDAITMRRQSAPDHF